MQYSIVNYSELEEGSMRLDSEFYKPEFLATNNLLESKKTIFLEEITEKIDVGFVGSMVSQYDQNGVILLQTQNVDEFFIKTNECKKINLAFHNQLKKSQIHYGDILIARSGSFGKASLYLEENIINSADIIIVKVKESLNPFYLCTFLNSKFGVNQLFRFASGGLQGHVNLTILESLKVPILNNNFQNLIEKTVYCAYQKRESSKSLYTEAENLLLSELELETWKPQHKLSYVKNFSDTADAERIDAEYFQPKYDEIIKKIEVYKGGFDTLGKITKIKDKNFNPENKKTYKYIELSNISNNGEITGFTEDLGDKLPSRARRKVRSGDVIISSIEGSLKSIALVNNKLENALCSTGFYVIDSKEINSETLLCFLKIIAGQLQLKKGCKGTILTAISKPELEKILLPKIKPEIQKQIKEKITEMYRSKQESKELLKKAKRAVEIAIEDNEKKAMKHLKASM